MPRSPQSRSPRKRGRPRIHADATARVAAWRAKQRAPKPLTKRTLRRHAQLAAQRSKATEECWNVSPTAQVLCQDIRHVSEQHIPSDSLDVIITDPPYDRAALPLYEALSAFSARTLKPGGSLLVLCGQLYLPEVLTALASHLAYKWTLGWHMPGPQTLVVWSSHAHNRWKPVLLFAKEPWKKPTHYSDFFSVPLPVNLKLYHPWEQAEEGMRQLFTRFTSPGMRVCDPFLGGGTTGVVALEYQCHFIGIEINPVIAATAVQRLQGKLDKAG